MAADHRILTPIAASLIAGALVGAATLGGTFAGDVPAQKSDRFAMVGDNLCKGQEWPNLTSECLSWAEGDATDGRVRYVTLKNDDPANQTTTLVRIREIVTN